MLRSFFFIISSISSVWSQTLIPTTVPPTTLPPFQGPAACLLTLPPTPLTAIGLSTPFQLQGTNPAQPCTMANQQTTTFVEAIIFDPTTYHLYIYHPLIIDTGTTPFLPPILPQLPNNAIVALFFGTNGLSLTLQPLLILQQINCVNGISQTDIFGQFAYCNAILFYDAVNKIVQEGKSLIPPLPPLGTAIDGKDCPTTRSFFMVDQDPSDNLVTTYLLDPITNRVFQDTPTNRLQYPTAIILKNGSDNRLLTLLDNALGCAPYIIPVLTDPQGLYKVASLATNEIHANHVQQNPVALIPKGDPMTRVLTANGPIPSMVKINAYRKGVNQPVITNLDQAPTNYFCVHMIEQLPRLQDNKALFTTQLSPDPAAANSLFTFLANRFSQSYINLRCDAILDVLNPVTLVTQNDIVIDATFTIIDQIRLNEPDPYLLDSPTTLPPTTFPPTTLPPTTIPPTTIPPTTFPPTTIPPTTIPPTTLQPTTLQPTTILPTTTPDPLNINNVQPAITQTTIIYVSVFSAFLMCICGTYVCKWYRNRNVDQTITIPNDQQPILMNELDEEIGIKDSPRNKQKSVHLPRLNKSVKSATIHKI